MTTTVTTMHAVTLTCDRCGKQNKATNENESIARAHASNGWGMVDPTYVYGIGELNGRPSQNKKKLFDYKTLCPECLDDLDKFLANVRLTS